MVPSSLRLYSVRLFYRLRICVRCWGDDEDNSTTAVVEDSAQVIQVDHAEMLLLLKIVSSFMIQQGCFPRCWLDGVLCRASQGQGLPVSVRYFYKRVCLGLVQIECSSDCANKRYSKSWCIG